MPIVVLIPPPVPEIEVDSSVPALYKAEDVESSLIGIGSASLDVTSSVAAKYIGSEEVDSTVPGKNGESVLSTVPSVDFSTQVWSGVMGTDRVVSNPIPQFGTPPPSPPTYSDGFTQKSLRGVAVVGLTGGGSFSNERVFKSISELRPEQITSQVSHDSIATVLKISYDYDFAEGKYRRALTFEAPDVIRKYGRIEREVELKWVHDGRTAIKYGERAIQYLAKPKWAVKVNTGLENLDVPPGVWVNVYHDFVPDPGNMLVLDSNVSLGSGSVELNLERVNEHPVNYELIKISTEFEEVSVEGITVVYANGVATFTIVDELNRPLAGALITLDGAHRRMSSSAGVVQYETTRGVHKLLLQATGYEDMEIEVNV